MNNDPLGLGNYNPQALHQPAAPVSTHTSPYAHGLAGVTERFLPAIGSVAGAVGGTLLAPGLGTAAGGAGGAVLGQKLQDLLTGQHTSGAGYAEQAAFGTLGGVGKGLGAIKGAAQASRAGEGLGGAVNALRYGSKGAAAVASGAGDSSGVLGNAITATNANAGNAVLGVASKGVSKVGKQAMLAQTGSLSKGTAQNALRDISDLRGLGYSNFTKAAEHAPAITGPDGALTVARDKLINSPQAAAIDTSGFMHTVKSAIHDNVSLDKNKAAKLEERILGTATSATTKLKGSTPALGSIFDKHGLYGSEAGMNIVNPANFNNAMKDIGQMIGRSDPASPERRTLNEIYGAMKGHLNDSLTSVPIDKGMKAQITNQLKLSGVNNSKVIQSINRAQSWGDLGQIESKFVTASKTAGESQVNQLRGGIPGLSQAGKPTLTGMLNQAGGRVAESAVSKGGNFAEKFLSKSPTEIQGAGQLAGKTAKSVGISQLLGRGIVGAGSQQNQPQDQTVQPDTSLTDTTPQTDNTPGFAQGTPFSQDNIQQAVMADMANGGKHVTELVSLYNAFGSPKAQQAQQKTLTADEQKRVDNMKQASATAQEYYNQLQQAGGGKGIAIGPAQSFLGKIGLGGQTGTQARALDSMRIDIATMLAQAMTGNSRPAQQQINFWMQSVPQISDPQPVAKQKLQNLMGLINSRTSAIGASQ